MSDAKKTDYDQPIEGHDYDGIQELDNPLPRWWLVTFWGTIIFAVIYYGYFEFGPGPTHDEALTRSMERIKSAQVAAEAAMTADLDVDIDALMKDETAIAVGKAQYDTKCMPCHGPGGGGLVGPNLTDDYWIHSRGKLPGIVASIRSGFPEKGMPAWGAMIPREEHVPLAAYVMTLHGTDPTNAKAPEGSKVED